MALRARSTARNVVVLTIDPAKRLAQALGIRTRQRPQQVPLGPRVAGELPRDDARHAPHLRRNGAGILRSPFAHNRFWTTSSIRPSPPPQPAHRNTWPWKLGRLLAQDRWDPGGGRHPAVAQRLDFHSTPPSGSRQLHGQPDVELFLGPGRGFGKAGDRRDGAGDEGGLDHRRFPDAFRRCAEFRAVTGHHVRRVPGEGGSHPRTAQAPGHPVRGGRRTRRAAGGEFFVDRLSAEGCRWQA